MIIETISLSEDPKSFAGEEDASALELEDDMFFRDHGPFRYELQARVVSAELLVEGKISARLSCRCARCDEWFPREIVAPDFFRSYKLKTKNETVDLTDDMREDIILALPMRFICSSSCSGLCPQCGANLNNRKCSCEKDECATCWNKLDSLDTGI